MKRPHLLRVICALFATIAFGLPRLAASQQTPIFNTVKQKLAEGHQVVGATVATADADIYCAVANSGFDFIWIEMQHSPLTYTDAARMTLGVPGPRRRFPFIRIPAATEGDIQKATDIGALGIIVPMVDSMEEIRDAVTYAHYPPFGKRSQGRRTVQRALGKRLPGRRQ